MIFYKKKTLSSYYNKIRLGFQVRVKRIGFTFLHEDKKTPTHLGAFTSFFFVFCVLSFVSLLHCCFVICIVTFFFSLPSPFLSSSLLFFYLSLLVSCGVVLACCHHHSSSCSSYCTLTFAHLILLLLLFILSHFLNFHLVTFVVSCLFLFVSLHPY